jgi:hypothetical protein
MGGKKCVQIQTSRHKGWSLAATWRTTRAKQARETDASVQHLFFPGKGTQAISSFKKKHTQIR